jgi:hypothetical protein
MDFLRVKQILDSGIAAWERANGRTANLLAHGHTFSWSSKAALLTATGHGRPLIPHNMIGNGKGRLTNLIIDLRRGLTGPGSRMPLGGPFIPDNEIQEIEDWINAGCPD